MNLEKRKGILISLLAIFLVALIVRGIYLFEMRASPTFEVLLIDEESYDLKAREIVETGDWIGDKVFYQDPFYPYFLALLYKVFGHALFLVRMIQALIGAITCLLIYALASRVFDRVTGLVAGLLAAIYKPFFFHETLIIKSSFVLFFITLALWLLLEARRRKSIAFWIFPGLALGFGILVRGNYMLFAPLAGLWILAALWKESRKRSVAALALFVLGTALPILPVTIRNYAVAGDFVLTTSQAGTNFYTSHHPGNRTGTLESPPFINTIPAFEDQDFKREAERQSGAKDMKPSEVSRFWFRKGLAAIADDPGMFAYRTWKKLRYATSDFEPPDNQSLYFVQEYFSTFLRVNLFSFGVIFPFALLGLAITFRQRTTWLLHIFFAVYLVSLLIFYVFARSRLPLALALIIFAAYACVWFVRNYRSLQPRQWVPAALLFIAASVWVWWPVAPIKYTTIWSNLGAAYNMRNDLDKAEHAYQKVVELDPDLSTGHRGLGQVARNRGNKWAAEKHFRKAISMDSKNWQARAELGGILLASRRYSEAEEQLEAAKELYPFAPLLYFHLGTVYLRQSKIQEAQDTFKEGLRMDPEFLLLHFELAKLLFEEGRKEEARSHFERILEIAPDTPWAYTIYDYLDKIEE
ncbi:MAG: tetratricopeptide repeat protein [Planctomycetota bacterium]|jgi:4-amino-4-deoxy-L-arabinose transferase-like glycosyltransferase